MSTDNIVTHPAFDRTPVVNPKTRGCPRGTASFRTARRRKMARKENLEIEQLASDMAMAYSYLSEGMLLNSREVGYVQQKVNEALADIKARRGGRPKA
jgi:hypothetical protein